MQVTLIEAVVIATLYLFAIGSVRAGTSPQPHAAALLGQAQWVQAEPKAPVLLSRRDLRLISV